MVTKDRRGWFIIIYKIPAKPSTARVTVWKKVRELGSLPLQQSVYILPRLAKLKAALNHFQEQIQQFGGECKILEIASFEESQEKETIAEFNNLRNQEYREIEEESERLLQEIYRETKADKFNFAESIDIERRFLKLKEWFEAVEVRDFFGADMKGEAAKAIKECKSRVEAFSREVFAREQSATKEKSPEVSGLTALKPGQIETETQYYTREELQERLKQVISDLANNILKIGDEEIHINPESTVLELKYKASKGKSSLAIEIEW